MNVCISDEMERVLVETMLAACLAGYGTTPPGMIASLEVTRRCAKD